MRYKILLIILMLCVTLYPQSETKCRFISQELIELSEKYPQEFDRYLIYEEGRGIETIKGFESGRWIESKVGDYFIGIETGYSNSDQVFKMYNGNELTAKKFKRWLKNYSRGLKQ